MNWRDDNDVEDDLEDDLEDGGGVLEPEAGMAVWVMAEKCTTCIFRPGNLMHLNAGRVKAMVEGSAAHEGHIVCHDTLLYGYKPRLRPAVCRGYFEHPEGNARSLALRIGRALGTIRYQQPMKEPSVLLADLVATTGLSMTITRGEARHHSTNFMGRDWEITYHLDTRTLDAITLHLGEIEKEPDLLECLTYTLDAVRLVRDTATYEQWAQRLGGSDKRQWPSPAVYQGEAIPHAAKVRAFLGDLVDVFLDAQGTNTGDHDDQSPATLDTLLTGHPLPERPDLQGVTWMTPDCTHENDTEPNELCTWRVLAVHRLRVRVAGTVRETLRGYQAVTQDRQGEELRHPVRAARSLAIADIVQAYHPSRHA